MAASLIAAAVGGGVSLYNASKARSAAKSAANQQIQGIETGINQSQPYYEAAQNFLSPYVTMGQQSGTLINDIIGLNGPEAQQRAAGMYQSSPSANLLRQAQEEAARRTVGEFASGGLSRSGAMATELARRQADLSLGDFYKWQDLGTGVFNTGANAASRGATLADARGGDIMAARTGQGATRAAGTIGAANANIAGFAGANNYLQDFLNRGGSNDFFGAFSTTTPGSAANGGWSTTTTPSSFAGLTNLLRSF